MNCKANSTERTIYINNKILGEKIPALFPLVTYFLEPEPIRLLNTSSKKKKIGEITNDHYLPKPMINSQLLTIFSNNLLHLASRTPRSWFSFIFGSSSPCSPLLDPPLLPDLYLVKYLRFSPKTILHLYPILRW